MNDFEPVTRLSQTTDPEGLWFLFREGKLLVKTNGQRPDIPRYSQVKFMLPKLDGQICLGRLKGTPCFAGLVTQNVDPPAKYQFKGLRGLFGLLDETVFGLAGRSYQLVNWDWTHRYCGRCGSLTADHQDERAKTCTNCGLIRYPSVSPAIIVAIHRGDRILLAHSSRHRSGWYSVLAGFVEPGETLESCVKREVKEEVGIDVKHIRYFGSQPWPFPNSLMVGFTAEYAGGDIVIDGREIFDARWFSAADMPPVPGSYTIARQLIDHFVHSNGRSKI